MTNSPTTVRGRQAARLAREDARHQRADDEESRTNFDLSLRTLEQIVEQAFICNGMVKRNGTLQRVSRLNKPLTLEEKALIKHIKRISIPDPDKEFADHVDRAPNANSLQLEASS